MRANTRQLRAAAILAPGEVTLNTGTDALHLRPHPDDTFRTGITHIRISRSGTATLWNEDDGGTILTYDQILEREQS